MSLQKTIERLHALSWDGMTIGCMLDSADEDAAGFLLLLSSLIVLLPTSAVPGITPLCAYISLMAGLSVLMGWKSPKLPRRLREIRMHPRLANSLIASLERIDLFLFRNRRGRYPLRFFMQGTPLRLAAGVACILAATTIIFSFIPFLNLVLMMPVCLLGLGICTHSGLIIASSWGVLATSVGFIPFFL